MAVLALAALAGCARLVPGGDTGPHGLATWDHRVRSLLASGRHGHALALVGPDSAEAGDELLRLQHEGLVAHYAGEWRRSSEALERAHALSEDRYTRSVSQALLSVLANDRVLDYRPPLPERLFLHYYGALNYLRVGEPDEAAVEARRLGYLLQRSLDGDEDDVPPELGGALSHFAGAVFERAGQANDAAVAYRRARAFRHGGTPPSRRPEAAAVAGPAPAAGSAGEAVGGPAGASTSAPDRPPLPAADSVTAAAPPSGEVLLVVERGFVAHRVEQDATVFLLPGEIDRLRRLRRAADDDERDADAREALEIAERVADRSFGGGRRARRAGGSGADPVLLRVAWPVYRQVPLASGTSRLVVDGDSTAVRPLRRIDLSGAVREAYRDRRAMDVAKTLLRAVAKNALAEGIEDAVSEEDETLGEVAGWTARIAGALLERADTRSWHLLPARLEVYRVRLPPGAHRLEVAVPGGGAGRDTLTLEDVEVEPGGLEVRTVRAWN